MTRALHILLVDDEEIVHKTLGDYLRDLSHRVEDARDGLTGLKRIEANDYDLALIDIRMPGMDGLALLNKAQALRPEMSVVLITGHGNMEAVVQALRLGAADFLTKPIKLLELDAVVEKAARIQELRQSKRRLRETIRGIQTAGYHHAQNQRLVGVSSALQEVREQIRQAVEANCKTILVTGETGTGKEVVAREIHFQASSEESPFIAVNCPALPESLAESELFGHVKGAFTGATSDRAGYFELADGGTLFLDEIADLSPAIQAKLLRVLETRILRRVGGSKEIHVDVRVIAATNVYLEEWIETGKFRRDLFYRLNVFPIYVPPLRERPEDIFPLAEHFLSMCAVRSGRPFDGFSPEAKELLLSYHFPGNVRELYNLVERATILCPSKQILAEHIAIPKRPQKDTPVQSSQLDRAGERDRILKALEETKWNRRQAAKNLGIPYSTFRFKMDKLGIS
jgi:DNA-binding NtrC family response regulator